MSLRSFHLFFIGISVILAGFFSAWSIGEYRAAHDAVYVVVAAASALTAVGLAMYGAAFQRKTKHL
jgi:hypothetical protein